MSLQTISSQTPFDLDLGLKGTHVLITGGCGLIGRVVVQAFLAAGCNTTVLDVTEEHPFADNDSKILYLQANITSQEQLHNAFQSSEKTFGPVEVCVALASLDLSVLPQSESLADMDPKDWQRVFDVNINGTFLTCQRWLQGLRYAASDATESAKLKNVNLILMGSEAGRFGVRTMAAYAAGKSAVQYGLLHSLAQDVPRIYPKARVNAVAPGAVDTERFREETMRYGEDWYWAECQATVPLAKPVPPEDVARTILFLASERYSGSIHGQLLHVDGGKTGGLVWAKDELAQR